MRRLLPALMIATVLTMTAGLVSADPPARPLEMTQAQFDRLCELEADPANAAVLDVHATYKSEREERMEKDLLTDDILTAAHSVGFPIGLVLILIAAAPL